MASQGAVRGMAFAGRGGQHGYRTFAGYRGAASFNGYGRGRYGFDGYGRGSYGGRYSGSYSNSGAYGVAPFGTPSYVGAGVFTPGNPTQTAVSPPAIYQIEASGVASRTARGFSNERRPGIYPVGVSDGVQPSIYVIRVPRG